MRGGHGHHMSPLPSPSGESRRALIIGGGPAGLTAAYELVTRAGIRPLVCEKLDILGGIARTVNYKGNRIDIGGHRFFSKSDRVMEWWRAMMPFSRPRRRTSKSLTRDAPARSA